MPCPTSPLPIVSDEPAPAPGAEDPWSLRAIFLGGRPLSYAGRWITFQRRRPGGASLGRLCSSCTMKTVGGAGEVSSTAAVAGFRAFFPMLASLVTTMISQTGVQENRVRFICAVKCDHRKTMKAWHRQKGNSWEN